MLVQRHGVSRSSKLGKARMFRAALSSATFIAHGKLKELAELVSSKHADVAVFCNLLSQTRRKRILRSVGMPVIIRTPVEKKREGCNEIL